MKEADLVGGFVVIQIVPLFMEMMSSVIIRSYTNVYTHTAFVCDIIYMYCCATYKCMATSVLTLDVPITLYCIRDKNGLSRIHIQYIYMHMLFTPPLQSLFVQMQCVFCQQITSKAMRSISVC